MESKSSAASIWKDGWNPHDPGKEDAIAADDGNFEENGTQTAGEEISPEVERTFASRPKPRSLQDLGVPEIFLADLTLKHCFFMKIFTLVELKDRLKLPTTLISDILDYLRLEEYL